MDFTRQKAIFNPEEQELNIFIVGAGSTGSFISLTLTKMGFENLFIIDNDKVEEHNIPNQFYRTEDISKFKIEALQEIVNDFTGLEIGVLDEKITEKSEMDYLDLNSLVILCVDNMKARKIIYKKIKDLPIKLIDTRMGGEGYQIYSIDLEKEEDKKFYEKTLNAEIKSAPCGEKAVIYTILSLASECSNIVKKIDKRENYPRTLKRELKTYTILQN